MADARRPGADPRDQLARFEGLAEVVVGTELQAIDAIVHLGGCREHQDPRLRAGEFPAHPVAVYQRQVAIEDNYVP
jgi:hypothetical protein